MYGDRRALFINIARGLIILLVLAGVVALVVTTVRIATRDENANQEQATTGQTAEQSVAAEDGATGSATPGVSSNEGSTNGVSGSAGVQNGAVAPNDQGAAGVQASTPVTGGEDLPNTGMNPTVVFAAIVVTFTTIVYRRSKQQLLRTLGGTRIHQ